MKMVRNEDRLNRSRIFVALDVGLDEQWSSMLSESVYQRLY